MKTTAFLLSQLLPDIKEEEALAYLLVLVLTAKVFWQIIVSTYRNSVCWLAMASKRVLNSLKTPRIDWCR